MPTGTYDRNAPLTAQEQKAVKQFVRAHNKKKLSHQQLVYRRLVKNTLRKYQLIACEQGVIHPEEVV